MFVNIPVPYRITIYLIAIIKSEIWPICHCLWIGRETWDFLYNFYSLMICDISLPVVFAPKLVCCVTDSIITLLGTLLMIDP